MSDKLREFSKLDVQYAWNLGLNVVIFKDQKEVVRGNKKNNPEMKSMIGSGEYSFFVSMENNHRVLNFLTGQIFIGFFCGYVFSLISLGLLGLTFLAKDIHAVFMMLPILLFTVGFAVVHILIGKRALKKFNRIVK